MDDPWKDDLLARKEEASLLTGYIESIATHPNLRDDCRSHTIAIDSEYGVGKTFFLKRLAASLRENHPVAYVDAWADDLFDEPFVSLAATLDLAFAGHKARPKIKAKLNNVVRNAGHVAALATVGALKKGVARYVGDEAYNQIREVVGSEDISTNDALKEGSREIANQLVQSRATNDSSKARAYMRHRIDEYRAGQEAVSALRDSISELVLQLDSNDLRSPIVIIIDELDRCRPSYAVKLLEQVKHIFDVPGVVFILGINGSQLSKSISHYYGVEFDGRSYLRRFILRTYTLKRPLTAELVEMMLQQTKIKADAFWIPDTAVDNATRAMSLANLLAFYIWKYHLSTRDIFSIVDDLSICAHLSRGTKLLLPYLLPIIISRRLGYDDIQFPKNGSTTQLTYVLHDDEGKRQLVDPWSLARQIRTASASSVQTRYEQYSHIAHAITQADEASNGKANILTIPKNYWSLVAAVGRFGSGNV